MFKRKDESVSRFESERRSGAKLSGCGDDGGNLIIRWRQWCWMLQLNKFINDGHRGEMWPTSSPGL